MPRVSIDESEAATVADRLFEFLKKFANTHYFEPDSVAVGPMEYLGLSARIAFLDPRINMRAGELTSFMGVPISVKTDPGFSAIVDSRKVLRFVKGKT